MFRKNVYILGVGFSANAGAPVMANFVEQAKLLRDDARLGLPTNDQQTFERVFKRLAELRVAQSKMEIDIENIEHLFSLLDMDIEFGGKTTGTLRRDLILLILRTLERTIRTEGLSKGPRMLPIQEDLDPKRHVTRVFLANYVELFCAMATRKWIIGPFSIPDDGKCQDTIITMDYDCLVDDCLTKMGVGPAYQLNNAELPQEIKRCPCEIPVLKLHGSSNWFACYSDQCKGRIWVHGGTPAQRLEYFYGRGCRQCGQSNKVEPLIVPPTWAKGGQSEILRPVWTRPFVL